jgi:rSAM/selenodomain-associated transferase 2/rSAM/selenodomain-associated transferase 1
MRVSIIVPALDEATEIAGTLGPLQGLRAAGHEVIVVDGGSVDATLALARPLADRAIVAPRGRAAQMNAGAAVASGDVLVFLHADTRLPAGHVDALVRLLPRSRRRWGRFDVAIDGSSRALPMVAAMMNLRSRLTGIATGDQGIFIERALFGAVGGYPGQPLMEDVDLSKRLKRAAGRPLCLRDRVVTSGRRWERDGAWRTIVAMWRRRLVYWACGDPARAAQDYAATRRRTPVTLQVFARSPVAGSVKTRLAASIGEQQALAVHVEFVERTLATATAARAAGFVDTVELWCAPDAAAPGFADWRERHGVTLRSQPDGDLGVRMRVAMDGALSRGSRAILIGTDCPALDVGYLEAAALALGRHDAVLGPVEDGGYVLIGLRRPVAAFDAVPWSSPGTLAATRAALARARATWHELPTLWDVDVATDLARWRDLSTTRMPAAGSPRTLAG